jgi:hypothetical protein
MRYKAMACRWWCWQQGVRHRLVARLAAKGTNLLGVKAVIAETFERIHRSNLVAWACCPCNSRKEKIARSSAWTARRPSA